MLNITLCVQVRVYVVHFTSLVPDYFLVVKVNTAGRTEYCLYTQHIILTAVNHTIASIKQAVTLSSVCIYCSHCKSLSAISGTNYCTSLQTDWSAHMHVLIRYTIT